MKQDAYSGRTPFSIKFSFGKELAENEYSQKRTEIFLWRYWWFLS